MHTVDAAPPDYTADAAPAAYNSVAITSASTSASSSNRSKKLWDWSFYKGKLYQVAYSFRVGGNSSYWICCPQNRTCMPVRRSTQ
eukprot:11754364-Ditylum_brightwellii.AAC.1